MEGLEGTKYASQNRIIYFYTRDCGRRSVTWQARSAKLAFTLCPPLLCATRCSFPVTDIFSIINYYAALKDCIALMMPDKIFLMRNRILSDSWFEMLIDRIRQARSAKLDRPFISVHERYNTYFFFHAGRYAPTAADEL
uniref:Uncharacterized protein n=1 Tax=Wuchereria bancrofti TaxID=6293 RepID=A0AAF5PKW0_WUCBA